MDSQKLTSQIEFLREIDKMKSVLRQNWVIGNARREDDAAHSWHAAMMALTLSEYAKPTVNIDRAVREALAADRVEALLPDEQGKAYRALWEEFDKAETDDAQYAAAIDRLQPLLLNYYTDGASWKGRTVTREQVYARNALTKEVLPALWAFVEFAVESCYKKGLLK